ncbi:MAG: hypothetical protein WCJ64_18225 [Rhodospirillaceae bacterium]
MNKMDMARVSRKLLENGFSREQVVGLLRALEESLEADCAAEDDERERSFRPRPPSARPH